METDYELLYLAKEEPETVIEILYKKYNKLLYSKAQKYSSSKEKLEDYLNEAKISLYDAVENYQDYCPFIVYLNTCIDRGLINYKKSLNRNKHKLLNDAMSINNEDFEININDERYNPEKLVIEELEYVELKEKILNQLTWKEELIFNLKEQNYTTKEISEITDNNLRTVYNIIHRIKNKVSNLMSN